MVGALLELLRLHQWVKNLLVFAPLFFSGRALDGFAQQRVVLAALAFCLLSSAVYVFNDLLDREADRRHRTKRERPIPSGRVSVATAAIVAVVLLAGALLVAAGPLRREPGVLASLLVYGAINVSYTLGLKHVAILELFLVASGFVLRLLAGGAAAGIELTSWILICTGTGAMLVVVGKRRADLALDNDPAGKRRSLAAYSVGYLDHLTVILAAATLVAYLMFCTSDYAVNRFGEGVLLTAVLAMAGICRYLQLVMVGRGGDDPTEQLFGDRALIATFGAWAATFAALIYAR